MNNILVVQTNEDSVNKHTLRTLTLMISSLSTQNYNFILFSSNPILINFFESNKLPYTIYKHNFVNKLKFCSTVKKINKEFTISHILCLSIFEKINLTKWANLNNIKILWLESDDYSLRTLSGLKFKKYLKNSENSLLISSSRSLKNELVDKGIAKNNIITIPNSINKNDFPIDKKPPMFINKGIFTIGTIINSSENGIISLISAMQAVWNIIPNLYIIIINQGPRQPTLKWTLSKAAIDSRTRIINKQKQTFGWIKAFDLLILPDKIPSYSYKYIFEAQYLKTALLTSNHGCFPEFIINNVSGLTFKSGNIDDLTSKIIKLYNNPDLMDKFEKEAYSRLLEKYNVEAINQKYKEILLEN